MIGGINEGLVAWEGDRHERRRGTISLEEVFRGLVAG
jgi:hypothetical protein